MATIIIAKVTKNNPIANLIIKPNVLAVKPNSLHKLGVQLANE